MHCSSPFFSSKAVGQDQLSSKFDIFTLRANPNPGVAVMQCEPAPLGFVPEKGHQTFTTPYDPATLNLVSPGAFSGTWRVYTCSCSVCRLGRPGVCSFYGVGVPPPLWEGYIVTRQPAAPGKGDDSFIARLVDSLALVALGGPVPELEVFIQDMGAFIKKKLHRFTSEGAAQAYVRKRVAKLEDSE